VVGRRSTGVERLTHLARRGGRVLTEATEVGISGSSGSPYRCRRVPGARRGGGKGEGHGNVVEDDRGAALTGEAGVAVAFGGRTCVTPLVSLYQLQCFNCTTLRKFKA
jgi:hypothetical protein